MEKIINKYSAPHPHGNRYHLCYRFSRLKSKKG